MLGKSRFVEDAGDDRLAQLAETLFHPSGVDGVYARTGRYEGIVEALAALISTHRPAGAEVLRFPPVMSRKQLERHGYLKSFPNLLGCVSCLSGAERRHPRRRSTASNRANPGPMRWVRPTSCSVPPPVTQPIRSPPSADLSRPAD